VRGFSSLISRIDVSWNGFLNFGVDDCAAGVGVVQRGFVVFKDAYLGVC
jgi:hypothetical protein